MNSGSLSQGLQLPERQADYLLQTGTEIKNRLWVGSLHLMPTDSFTFVTLILELIKIQYALVWISENKQLNT